MPTISPTSRPVTTTEESFRQPRAQVKAATGMNLPPPIQKEVKPVETKTEITAETDKTGQLDTSEETDPKEVTLSPQLTALARKQQKLQSEIQAQRDKEAAFAAKEADYIPKSSLKAKFQENAVEALKEIGMDYEELTNLMLAQSQAEDPVKKLEAKIDGLVTSQQEAVSKQYEATLNQYRSEIKDLIEKDENFITIREEKQEAAVLDRILKKFNEEGTVLSVEDASKEIEDELVESAFAKANLTKVKAKLAPATEPEKTLPPPKAATKTLTNQVETAPTRTFGQFQHLSMKERIAQAMARAQK